MHVHAIKRWYTGWRQTSECASRALCSSENGLRQKVRVDRSDWKESFGRERENDRRERPMFSFQWLSAISLTTTLIMANFLTLCAIFKESSVNDSIPVLWLVLIEQWWWKGFFCRLEESHFTHIHRKTHRRFNEVLMVGRSMSSSRKYQTLIPCRAMSSVRFSDETPRAKWRSKDETEWHG